MSVAARLSVPQCVPKLRILFTPMFRGYATQLNSYELYMLWIYGLFGKNIALSNSLMMWCPLGMQRKNLAHLRYLLFPLPSSLCWVPTSLSSVVSTPVTFIVSHISISHSKVRQYLSCRNKWIDTSLLFFKILRFASFNYTFIFWRSVYTLS